jgi:hypothetical protein
MKHIKTWATLAVAASVILGAATAQAGDWRKKAELTAGGDGKEVKVGVNIKDIMIRCMEGSVVINTVWERQGDKKIQHKVTRTLNKGEDHIIRLGESRMVTGLRIGDGGRGTYRVFVRN